MPTESAPTAMLFSVLVLVVAPVVLLALRRRGALGLPGTIGIFVAYLVIPGLLAWRGAIGRYDPLPAPALLLLLALTLLTVGILLSPVGVRLASGLALGAVVAFQAFRVPVELLLHRMYTDGTVPVQMTYTGRNFDVVTGVSGLVLGFWLLSGRSVPRGVIRAWNILGLALLANIVSIAVLSTPVPFRRFLESPPHTLPSTFPYIWLPSFLVQVALGSHLLVFRQLRRGAQETAGPGTRSRPITVDGPA